MSRPSPGKAQTSKTRTFPHIRKFCKRLERMGNAVPIDRNERVRIIYRAEAYERKSKMKGRPGGALGLTGIALLRIIIFRYFNVAKGAAWPSYDELQRVSGFARQTIADAIKRLERAGFLLVTRRAGWNGQRIVRETNLYRLPLTAPALPESLAVERQPKIQELSDGLRAAFDALAQRMKPC